MSTRINSQITASIYAPLQAGDSADIVVKLLTEEFKKAGIVKVSILDESLFTKTGILLLTTSQAEENKIPFPAKLKSYGPEGVYIKGNDQSVIIIGNSMLALQEAVFIYLEQLGFSYLLPGETWQNIPKLTTVCKSIGILTQPDYEYRWIANGHGYYGSAKIESEFNFWAKSNRLGGSFQMRAGHIYDEIVQRNATVFKQHPEYFAEPGLPKGTIPNAPKFNVADKNLVRLIIDDAISRLELQKKNRESSVMISMEPSDGQGFCTTPECIAIGSPSDQAYYLSNEVAKELKKKYPGTWVGSLAYNEHILPTKYKLEPNTFVMITNGFNRTKFSTDELLQQWNKKAGKVGVYEYLSVYEWDNDMPGQVMAAKTKFIKKSIVQYYKSGARAYMGESTIGWVSRGPGQYLAAKLLWNTSLDMDSLKNDFYKKAFGDVSGPIKKLYDAWENYPHRVPSDNDLTDWLSLTDEAYKKTNSPVIKKRIDCIKLYIHYTVLYKNLKKKPSEENLNKALSFAYRNFENPSFATLPAMVSLANYSGFPGKGIYDNPDQAWKNNKTPYTDAELQKDFQQDLAAIKKAEGMKLFAYSDEFTRLTSLELRSSRQYAKTPHALWGKTEYVFRIQKKSDQNYLQLSSGFSASPPVDRPVSVEIYPIKKTTPAADEEKALLIFNQSIKNKIEKFSLQQLTPGYYRMRVNDQLKMFILNFSQAVNYSLVLKPDDKILTTTVAGLNTFYFYVPKGVKKFFISKTVSLQLKSPSGRLIDKQNNADESFYIDVLNGEEGIWTIEKQGGNIYIEGVPPYLGDHPLEMLLPSYITKTKGFF
jgi:Domain of unknown function (DUF4838)